MFVSYDFEHISTGFKFDQPLKLVAVLTDGDWVPQGRVDIESKLIAHIRLAP